MTRDGIVVTILSIVGFILFGTLLLLLLFRPKSAGQLLKVVKVPWSYWGNEPGAIGFLLLLVPVLFLFFSCILCFILFGFIQSAHQ